MHWSVLLGLAVLGYAAFILVRHVRGMCRGDCGACPYRQGCNKKH